MGIAFLGRIFVDLRQQSDQILCQKILIVDNGRISLQNIFSAVEMVNGSFVDPDIWVIASARRVVQLRALYPGLKYVLPVKRNWSGKYWIASKMLAVRNKNFDFVILFSLDISPLVVSMLFMNSKTMLYNQWGEWWHLSLRHVSQAFDFGYIRGSKDLSFKGLIKRIGLFIVFPQKQNTNFFTRSILLVDNGCASREHVKIAIHEIMAKLPRATIFKLSMKEVLLKNIKYDYVFLLSLEVLPIFVVFLCMQTKLILFNQWRQWWTLQIRPIHSFVMVFLFHVLNFFVFIYLIFYAFFMLIKKIFNGLKI